MLIRQVPIYYTKPKTTLSNWKICIIITFKTLKYDKLLNNYF